MNMLKTTHKILTALIVLFMATSAAVAQNVKFSLGNLVLVPGKETVVSLELENDVKIPQGAIFADIFMPEGVTFVKNLSTDSYVERTSRVSDAASVMASTKKENDDLAENQLRVLILDMDNEMEAGEGAVLTFKVKTDVNAQFPINAVAEIKDASAGRYKFPDTKFSISDGTFVGTVTAPDFTITPSKEAVVTVNMTNNLPVCSFQTTITLPEGLSFVEETRTNSKGEEEKYCFTLANRVATSHQTIENVTGSTAKVMVVSKSLFEPVDMLGSAGPLFSFKVKADQALTAESVIKLTETFASSIDAKLYNFAKLSIKVTNPDADANKEADAALKALDQKVAETLTAFGEYADTVQTVLKEQKDALVKKLADVNEAAKTSKDKGTAAADLETLKAAIAETEAMATKLIEDADKTKKEIEDKAAAEKANAEQYAQDTLAVAAAEKALSEAVAGMAEYDESVKAAFAEAKTAAEAALATAKDAAEKSYKAGTSVADKDANAALVAAVNEAATKLAAESKAAQEKFLADKAAAEANAAQYANDSTALATVQKALDEAVAGMAEYDESVKTAMQGAIATAQAEINVAKVQIEASFAAATSVADAAKNAALVEKAKAVVAKVASDAKAAQDKFIADRDAKALEAAYTQATAVVADLNKAFATAQKTVATECADVKDSETVVAATAAVKAQITALSEAVEAAKADGSLTTTIETVLAPKAEIEAAITKMVEDAKAAQKVVDDKKAALDAAYAYAQQELASLKSSFATAQETIAKECADVKDSESVVAAATAIEAQITSAAEAIEAAKADGSLVNKGDELVAKKAEVEAAITKMVEDAKAAQKDFEAQKALDAAYAQAQELLNGLNQKLAAAQDAINTFCPDVKDGETVTAAVAAVKAQITALSEAVEAAKADGSLIEKKDELLSKKAEVEEAISQLPAIAQKAQKDFEAQQALDAAYAQATAVVNSLNQKLATAMEAIDEFCPDVKDSSLVVDGKAAIEAQIASLSEAIETAKADGSLTAEIVNILAPKTAIETAIDQLKADAKKAQHDIDTAIEGVEGSENISKIYTLSGKEVSRAEKGQVYIIRYVNGSTKKVMVK